MGYKFIYNLFILKHLSDIVEVKDLIANLHINFVGVKHLYPLLRLPIIQYV